MTDYPVDNAQSLPAGSEPTPYIGTPGKAPMSSMDLTISTPGRATTPSSSDTVSGPSKGTATTPLTPAV
jgi:hypothetical protein